MSEFKLGQMCYTLLDDGSYWDVFERVDKDLEVLKVEVIGVHKERWVDGGVYVHYEVELFDRLDEWTAQRKSDMLFKTKKEALEAATALRKDRVFRKRRAYEKLGKELEELEEVTDEHHN